MARDNYDYRWTLKRMIARRYDGDIVVWDGFKGTHQILWSGYGRGLIVANNKNSWPVTLVPTGYKCDRGNHHLPLYIHRALRRLGETFGSNDAIKAWIDDVLANQNTNA